MRIIKNGQEEDIIVITRFKFNRSNFLHSKSVSEYILYTDIYDTEKKVIKLARLFYIDNTINLMRPDDKEMGLLKDIIANFLSETTDLSLIIKNKYTYIDVKDLEDKKIIEVNYKQVEVPKNKYIKLLSNKYLTYPDMKILNMDTIEKEGYDKNNDKAKQVSVFALIMIFIGLVLLELLSIYIKLPYNISGISTGIALILSGLVATISYYNEEKKAIISWLMIFVLSAGLIIGSSFLYANPTDKIFIDNPIFKYLYHNNNYIEMVIIALILSIIVTIVYNITKKLSFILINKLKTRNFITYLTIFIIPFTVLMMGSLFVLNKYLSEPVYDLISKYIIK